MICECRCWVKIPNTKYVLNNCYLKDKKTTRYIRITYGNYVHMIGSSTLVICELATFFLIFKIPWSLSDYLFALCKENCVCSIVEDIFIGPVINVNWNSFTHIMNNSDPNMAPCGTSLLLLPIFTMK